MRCNEQYLGFDDRRMILVGIPLVSLIVTLAFDNSKITFQETNFWIDFLISLLFTIVFWMFNRFMLIGLRKRLPHLKDIKKRLTRLAVVSFIGYPVIMFVIGSLIRGFFKFIGAEQLIKQGSLAGYIAIGLIILLVLALYEAIYFFKQYKQSLLDAQGLKNEHVNTQLMALRNQVNPHFLFNSLNTLMSLIPSSAERAHSYLSKLSSFYRYSVSSHDEVLVSISKEMEILNLYADLIKERFGLALVFQGDLTSRYDEMTLPMTLQLLVENAVKHNIVSRDEPLIIKVFKDDSFLYVENNMQARITETASTGMGLNNIKQRYAYVSDREIKVHSDGSIFSVGIPIIHRDT